MKLQYLSNQYLADLTHGEIGELMKNNLLNSIKHFCIKLLTYFSPQMFPATSRRSCSSESCDNAASGSTSWILWPTSRARRSRGPRSTRLWTTSPPGGVSSRRPCTRRSFEWSADCSDVLLTYQDLFRSHATCSGRYHPATTLTLILRRMTPPWRPPGHT